MNNRRKASKNPDVEQFSWSEIEQHNKANDAWIVIDGFVHDVTEFLHEHPGGSEVVTDWLGKDATDAFSDPDAHMHSDYAYDVLRTFRIGIVKNATVTDRENKSEQFKSLVNFDIPVLPQLPKVGANYQPWLHSKPVIN